MDDFQRVKDAITTISAVITSETGFQAKRTGSQLILNQCPFCGGHECFNIRDAAKAYNCFQCPPGESGGDVFTFLQRLHGLTHAEALRAAAKHAGITIEEKGTERKPRMSAAEKIREAAAAYYHSLLDDEARAFLMKTRGHVPETIAHFRIGRADGRLLDHLRSSGFNDEDILESGLAKTKEVNVDGKAQKRIRDFFVNGLFVYPHVSQGKVIHFTMKDPNPDKEKRLAYQLPSKFQGKGWAFYNQDALDSFGEVILVEGENDTQSIWDAGVKNVLAMIGQISDEQIKWLSTRARGKKLFIWTDNDEGGRKYVRRICKGLPDQAIRIIVYGKEGDDPDSYLRRLAEDVDRKEEIKKLRLEALDHISWEISRLDPLETLEEKHREAMNQDLFRLISQRSEMEQQICIEKLERIGFTRKAIESSLDFSQELLTQVTNYLKGLLSAKDADPNHLAMIIYKYFSEHGRFYYDAQNTVWLIYKNKTYEVGNNIPFNALLHKMTKLLYTRAPGNSVWDALRCTAYNHGRRIDRAQWIHTDDVRGLVWANLNGPNNSILKISGDGITEITNGMNDDHILLSSSSEIQPFNFLPDTEIQEGMDLFNKLVIENMACDRKQRYFIVCWLLSAFVTDFTSCQGHMKFSGSAGGGKSTAAELISTLLYGKESLEDPTGAAAYSLAAQNPLLVIDNLESKDLSRTMQKFLLLAATRGGKAKRTQGSDSGTVKEQPRALICITAIEPFTLPELISRVYDIWFDRRKWSSKNFNKPDIVRQLKKKRDVILSSFIKFIQADVLPAIDESTEYMTVLQKDYPGHAKDRTNDYLAVLFVILNRLLKYIPFFDRFDIERGALELPHPETGKKYTCEEKEIRDAWIHDQDSKAGDTEVTSNNILKLFDGLVREYMLYYRGDRKPETETVHGYQYPVFQLQHPEYGLTIIKTVPEIRCSECGLKIASDLLEEDVCRDSKHRERYEHSKIEFVAQSKDIIYALDRFCRNAGLKNPYPDAAVFGARLNNDVKILEKGGWKRVATPGKEPYFKTVKGYNYWKFEHVLVR